MICHCHSLSVMVPRRGSHEDTAYMYLPKPDELEVEMLDPGVEMMMIEVKSPCHACSPTLSQRHSGCNLMLLVRTSRLPPQLERGVPNAASTVVLSSKTPGSFLSCDVHILVPRT